LIKTGCLESDQGEHDELRSADRIEEDLPLAIAFETSKMKKPASFRPTLSGTRSGLPETWAGVLSTSTRPNWVQLQGIEVQMAGFMQKALDSRQ
jgi:hypothetical protein